MGAKATTTAMLGLVVLEFSQMMSNKTDGLNVDRKVIAGCSVLVRLN